MGGDTVAQVPSRRLRCYSQVTLPFSLPIFLFLLRRGIQGKNNNKSTAAPCYIYSTYSKHLYARHCVRQRKTRVAKPKRDMASRVVMSLLAASAKIASGMGYNSQNEIKYKKEREREREKEQGKWVERQHNRPEQNQIKRLGCANLGVCV